MERHRAYRSHLSSTCGKCHLSASPASASLAPDLPPQVHRRGRPAPCASQRRLQSRMPPRHSGPARSPTLLETTSEISPRRRSHCYRHACARSCAVLPSASPLLGCACALALLRPVLSLVGPACSTTCQRTLQQLPRGRVCTAGSPRPTPPLEPPPQSAPNGPHSGPNAADSALWRGRAGQGRGSHRQALFRGHGEEIPNRDPRNGFAGHPRDAV